MVLMLKLFGTQIGIYVCTGMQAPRGVLQVYASREV